SRTERKPCGYDFSFAVFMCFMLHESPQQQHPCLLDAAVTPVVVVFAPSFIWHESPQQPSFAADVA
ncbi:MAG: hypothetical protein WAM70_17310, partial [Pyrinomonadaceae bacterium]